MQMQQDPKQYHYYLSMKQPLLITLKKRLTAAQQTLATGGQCMALSTPNGIGNWFHQTWEKAETGENSFVPVRLTLDSSP